MFIAEKAREQNYELRAQKVYIEKRNRVKLMVFQNKKGKINVREFEKLFYR